MFLHHTLHHSLAFCVIVVIFLSEHHNAPIKAPILTPPTISIGIPASYNVIAFYRLASTVLSKFNLPEWLSSFLHERFLWLHRPPKLVQPSFQLTILLIERNLNGYWARTSKLCCKGRSEEQKNRISKFFPLISMHI